MMRPHLLLVYLGLMKACLRRSHAVGFWGSMPGLSCVSKMCWMFRRVYFLWGSVRVLTSQGVVSPFLCSSRSAIGG